MMLKTLTAITVPLMLGGFVGWFAHQLWVSEVERNVRSAHREDLSLGFDQMSRDRPVTHPDVVSDPASEKALLIPGGEIDYDEAFARLEADGLRLVPKKVLPYLAGQVVQPDGRMSPKTVELLRLSPRQVTELNAAIKVAAERLAQLEIERVQKVTAAEGEVVFRIGELSTEGQRVKDDLKDAVISSLGERDGLVLQNLMNQPDSYFQGFGDQALDVLFYLVPDDENPSVPRAYFSVKAANPEADPPSGGRWGKPLHWTVYAPVSAGRHSYLLQMLPSEMQAHFVDHP